MTASIRRQGRQDQNRAQAAERGIAEVEAAAVGFRQIGGDGQAEARIAAKGLAPRASGVEPLEDPGQVRPRHAHARIADPHSHLARILTHANHDGPAVWTELHGVVEQVDKHLAEAGLARVEVRHGDIFATGLADGCADLVVVHRVLHFLSEPAAAVAEAARLVAPGGRLLIVDFAPHTHEALRQAHQHRRLGFSDAEIARWMEAAGLTCEPPLALPPQGPVADNDAPGAQEAGLTVKIWRAVRTAARTRSAA